MAPRTYSVQEADALLPELRQRLETIREARQVLLHHAEILRAKVTDHGGGAHPGPEYLRASESLRGQIRWLSDLEIVLRDPQIGLIDFPGEREGERVWLCWLLGEERVGHWHPLDTGFVGRRPL